MTDDQKAKKNANKQATRIVNYSDVIASVAANEGFYIPSCIIISITTYMVYFLNYYICVNICV
jgi:hypothetical protein